MLVFILIELADDLRNQSVGAYTRIGNWRPKKFGAPSIACRNASSLIMGSARFHFLNARFQAFLSSIVKDPCLSALSTEFDSIAKIELEKFPSNFAHYLEVCCVVGECNPQKWLTFGYITFGIIH